MPVLPIDKPWLPRDRRQVYSWRRDMIRYVDSNPQDLHPVIQEFRDMIEGDSRVYLLFSLTFEQIPKGGEYDRDPGGDAQIRDYHHMLQLMNFQLAKGPLWNNSLVPSGLVGSPINAFLAWPMATPSGFALFIDPQINDMIKKVLDVWGKFLESRESAAVLNRSDTGWFGEDALKELENVGNLGQTSHAFDQLYVCDPNADHYGFTSWDDFFTRPFRAGLRPVASPDDDNVIINACESNPYQTKHNVQFRDRFWLKSQRYSLFDMLAYDELSPAFVGGTVYQAFLGPTSYHRWHSPVKGTIVKAFVQPGTYFSEPPYEDIEGNHGGDIANQSHCQEYLSVSAARAIVFIQADNPVIGLMAFLAIGMGEVSTCQITVQKGQHVAKGEEIGMFHYGGSTYCLIFREAAHVYGFPMSDQPHNVPVNGELARVSPCRIFDERDELAMTISYYV